MTRGDSWASRAILTVGLVVALAGSERVAGAQGRAQCTIYEIKASAAPRDKLVKGKLPKHLVKKLKRGAFSQFKHFEVIGEHRLTLSPMRQVSFKLRPGKGAIMLRDIEGSGKRERFKLQLQLDDQSGKRLQEISTRLNRRDSLLIVDDGLKVPGGKYVFACTCMSG